MIDRNRLTDGDREILAELERDARPSVDDLDDLFESADCIEDVFGELLDAAYGRDDLPPADPTNTGGECDPNGFPY